jgi:hypothetical protein
VRERYGERAQTIVNNHRAKILGAGLADPHTLDFAARALDDEKIQLSPGPPVAKAAGYAPKAQPGAP